MEKINSSVDTSSINGIEGIPKEKVDNNPLAPKGEMEEVERENGNMVNNLKDKNTEMENNVENEEVQEMVVANVPVVEGVEPIQKGGNKEGKVIINLNENVMEKQDELEEQLKQEQKHLEDLCEKNMNTKVIETQEKVVNNLVKQISDLQAVQPLKAEYIDIELVDADGNKSTKKKKLAYASHNRPRDAKKIAIFLPLISSGRYEALYPIIVAKAKLLLGLRIELTDIAGKMISSDDADEYIVVLDGQHRSEAFAKAISIGKATYIPNVCEKNIDNIGEYLVNINQVGNWTTQDKAAVSALLAKDNTLVKMIAQRLHEKFNSSTLGLIYTGKALPTRYWDAILKGEEPKLPKNTNINIDRGEKFISMCQAVEMDIKFITKRYFINGFNSFAKSTSEDIAFEALSQLARKGFTDADYQKVKHSDDFITLLKGEKL